MEVESEIAKWYQGKAVFITGATGFMGKVLVEKLLRSCPDVGPIYVFVREKKKTLPEDRVEEIMSSSVFDAVRATGLYRKNCVIPIPGDFSLPDLGISAEHRHLLQETVSVVFHLAATVRFDEPLRIAVAINLEGTRALMQLCLGMTKLSAIVHVSTAYANCNRSVVEERVHPPPADLDKVLHCVAGMDDDLLGIIEARLIGNHPNTYTFTKALAEHLVAGYSSELPIVVVRPSIVSASWREPSPGWIDNFNGPTGLIAGVGKGLLKNVRGKDRLVADMIPVDVCINLFVAAAWEIGTRETSKLVPNVHVYNCVSGPSNPLSWKEFIILINSSVEKYPMSDALMSPHVRMTCSRVKYELGKILEALPASLTDACIRLSGGTPRLRYYQCKINRTAALLKFFINHEFEFKVENVEELKRRLNSVDRIIFNFDIAKIEWKEYVTTYYLGMRKYLMNETDVTIQISRERVACRWARLQNIVRFGVFVMVVIVFFSFFDLLF